MKTKLLKGLRKVYQSIARKEFPRWAWPSDSEWETTNELLFDLLSSNKPCYIGRIGTVEGAVVHNKLTITPPLSWKRLMGCYDYITGSTRLPWWDTGKPFWQLQNNAGFFSSEGILKNKKVLVIHPFKGTIEEQYKKREKLFPNPDSLPDFDLIVYKSVQSIASQKTPYKD